MPGGRPNLGSIHRDIYAAHVGSRSAYVGSRSAYIGSRMYFSNPCGWSGTTLKTRTPTPSIFTCRKHAPVVAEPNHIDGTIVLCQSTQQRRGALDLRLGVQGAGQAPNLGLAIRATCRKPGASRLDVHRENWVSCVRTESNNVIIVLFWNLTTVPGKPTVMAAPGKLVHQHRAEALEYLQTRQFMRT